MAWLSVAVSSSASSSRTALTVTAFGVSQLLASKVRRAGLADTSALSLATVTTTLPLEGGVSKTTVYVPLPPSFTLRSDVETVTPANSSSSTVTSTAGTAPL